uniref:Uncharacterized protein n=1 Tax=Timspurckia oligopyrenoides TaxID=708627 RepID=A0A7S0ZDV5_9RHOD|mmetsp:Transcript_1470/g.2645  ORF Transcript_1470/g.2645 Transcript_1470/m.2645 type:complete len:160 (+) Transcript_1470:3-482(+)
MISQKLEKSDELSLISTEHAMDLVFKVVFCQSLISCNVHMSPSELSTACQTALECLQKVLVFQRMIQEFDSMNSNEICSCAQPGNTVNLFLAMDTLSEYIWRIVELDECFLKHWFIQLFKVLSDLQNLLNTKEKCTACRNQLLNGIHSHLNLLSYSINF